MSIRRIALVLLLLSHAALAQRAPPAKGPPAVSCGSYVEARMGEVGVSGPNSLQFFSWIQGYLSGYNNYGRTPLVDVPESGVIAKYLDKYCQDNPMHHVSKGIESLLAELGGYRQPSTGR